VVATIREEAIPSAVPPLELLPTMVHIEDAGISTTKYLPFALDEDHRWVGLDLADNPYFLIVGPDKSGRSSTLGTLVTGLRRAESGLDFHLLATRDTPLAGVGGWASAATTADEAVTAAARLAELATKAVMAGDAMRFVVVIDDGDDLVDTTSAAATHIESIRKVARDLGGIVLASVSTFKAQRSYSLWLGAMRNNRQGLLLAGSSENSDIFQARLPRAGGSAVPPGRGYLFTSSGHRLVQVAV
jgi:S-DNA-T family DNA segregation ATPase FtsK/SpoIIIE